MKKRILSLLLVLALCLGILPVPAVGARDLSDAQLKAEALKSLNLFQGVSATDFDLDRAPTRLEALVMFIRTMGHDAVAQNSRDQHPFTDVPAWGKGYVGYAYQSGYTSGVSATKFGSQSPANAAMYVTFVLRALGYSDANGDFSYRDPFTLARSIGILPATVNVKNFLRADAVLVSWEALFVPMNGGNKALCDILVMGGTFTDSQLKAAIAKVERGPTTPSVKTENGVKLGTYVCSKDSFDFTYQAEYRPSVTLKAGGLCTVTINFGEGMATGQGKWTVSESEMGTGIHITILDKNWGDSSANYTFSLQKDGSLFKEDGGIGITPVESIFNYVG